MRILKVLCLIGVLAVVLSFSAFASVPVITAQPQNVYFPANQTFPVGVDFSLMASGDNLSYQWQASDDNGNSWVNSSFQSATTPTLHVNVHEVNVGTRLYRCVVSSSDDTVISQVVSVSVGGYLMDTLPQMLSWISEVGYSIFGWVAQSCTYIVSEPLLLFTIGFLAVGASIAIVSRLLSRS